MILFSGENVKSNPPGCAITQTGDAEFRTLSLYLLVANIEEVVNVGNSVAYRHPVPNWCVYATNMNQPPLH